MAPSRGKGKAAVRASSNATKASTRRSKRPGASIYTDDDVADVYKSMVAEAETAESAHVDRPLKRRRVAPISKSERAANVGLQSTDAITSSSPVAATVSAPARPDPGRLQTVEDSSESEGSDLEFEDVDVERLGNVSDGSVDGIEDLTIAVEPESSTSPNALPRRRPGTTIEKAHRLLVHKLHLLCLLGHCMYVNGRCNNAAAHRHVRSVLSSKTVSYLNPKKNDTQFQRNRSFMDGLEQAMNAFNAEYRVTGSGLMKPHWNIDGDLPEVRETGLPPTDSSDFLSAAKDLEGSQDLGNQLFCTLLRSVGVDARIVCSLQPLPFSSVPKSSTPSKASSQPTRIYPAQSHSPIKASSNEDKAIGNSKTIGKVPSARRRLGQPDFAAEASKPQIPKKKPKSAPKLQYPVFWVEVFNEASQKWIAVDAVVTNTVNKASKLEPPASYDLGQLNYVIACEDDGTARDVTRRYAKAFNAKTRRHRVESSPNGAKWWKAIMRFFRRRGGKLDREQVEDAELAQKEAREGMPANVLDFKDHPYYALERHLKRHETIHPRREVGKVNAGTAAKPRLEPVFRRQDVQVCKSADKWYRVGREIKEGEQPLKHVPARVRRHVPVDDEDEEAATTPLYAPFQTQLYMPPPVQRGRVPRNVYGNLDIYVPSMVPPGGTHIRHPLAQRAARLLKVDSADAVTGFKFQGRHGTAIIDGVVVAEQYADAVWAVIHGIEDEMEEEASRARSLIALKMWKRFLTGLRVAERVNSYADPSAESAEQMQDEDEVFVADPHGLLLGQVDDAPLITAGQFTLLELSMASKPARKQKRKHDSDTEMDTLEEDDYIEDEHDARSQHEDFEHDHDYEGGGFFHSEDGGGGFMVEDDGGGEFVHEHNAKDDEGGGGFVVEDDQEGGFLNEENNSGNDDNEHRVHEEMPDNGGGFLPEHEDRVDDLFGEETGAHVSPAPPAPEGIQQSMAMEVDIREEIAESAAQPARARTMTRSPSRSQNQRQASERPEEEQVDKDSLPSEDPDDDQDMEPDWLESD
ncbi:DNA repair protein rhp41 [Pseudocercospora fuligena]|uniref:DNA repair protein rhp41 n=1 Tax=Pseudocercospora fuligena TaxID=685502 RepID=A0A8H6RVY5_9PEZI|nr:DNA repair protein rhp41 [Pseudocercospora fuligena]